MDEDERKKEVTLQSKAFSEFEDGKMPADLVKEGICTISEAQKMYEHYMEFKEYESPEDVMIAKLLTQIGLIGSRLARVEIKLMNSMLLPKTHRCKDCGHEGMYGVGVVCQQCGNVGVHTPSELNVDLLKNVPRSGFRPWEEEEE